MNHLFTNLAPITESGWKAIEEEAQRTLKTALAARKLVDFVGPLGWQASAINPGRSRVLKHTPEKGVEPRLREVQPLLEVKVPFTLKREELDAIEGGAEDPDLQALVKAAMSAAAMEDRCIFHGYDAGHITGIIAAQSDSMLTITEDYRDYPGVVAEAINRLHSAGIAGPYAIALGPRCYTGLTQTRDSGYPLMAHLQRLVDGNIVWAPAIDGALVMSQRGGDFELTVGQDFSIGYAEHDSRSVTLYLQESFTFRALDPAAAVALKYSG